MFLGREKKPTFLGAINGMIVGLVAITPGAGYVNGFGALLEGIIASTIVWFAWTYIQPILLRRVDDAMGVVYTHGLAGLCGGLLVGIFADPSVVVYPNTTSGTPLSVTGWLYGNRHEFFLQILAALTVIVWDAAITFLISRRSSAWSPRCACPTRTSRSATWLYTARRPTRPAKASNSSAPEAPQAVPARRAPRRSRRPMCHDRANPPPVARSSRTRIGPFGHAV